LRCRFKFALVSFLCIFRGGAVNEISQISFLLNLLGLQEKIRHNPTSTNKQIRKYAFNYFLDLVMVPHSDRFLLADELSSLLRLFRSSSMVKDRLERGVLLISAPETSFE